MFQYFQKKYMDYPSHVHIETTGKCNGSCKFCPHSEIERKNEIMSDELFSKIINDLKKIPIPFSLSPFKVNEPLLDPLIFERIYRINKELPDANILFVSNFNTANEDTIHKLSQVKKLKYIWISLNFLDADEYKKEMGLNLDRTVDNIRLLLDYNRKNHFTDKIILGRVSDREGDEKFIEDAKNIFEPYIYEVDYKIDMNRKGEWLGYTESTWPKIDYPCNRWFELSITCTGDVALCCMDGKCEYPLGNVNNQNALDIYNSEYKRLRATGVPRRYVTPCKNCSFI